MPNANYTGTHDWTVQQIANYEGGQHATPASTNPEFKRVGAVVGTAPGTFSDGVDVVTWVDRRRFNNPHVDGLAIFTTATASNTVSATSTTLTGLGGLKAFIVALDITGTNGTTSTLDVLVDTNLGGTKWINILHFQTSTSTTFQAATVPRRIDVSVNTAFGDPGTANQAVNGVAQAGFGDSVRVRYTVTGATSDFTFGVYISGVA